MVSGRYRLEAARHLGDPEAVTDEVAVFGGG
jgi:hypothetical protein